MLEAIHRSRRSNLEGGIALGRGCSEDVNHAFSCAPTMLAADYLGFEGRRLSLLNGVRSCLGRHPVSIRDHANIDWSNIGNVNNAPDSGSVLHFCFFRERGLAEAMYLAWPFPRTVLSLRKVVGKLNSCRRHGRYFVVVQTYCKSAIPDHLAQFREVWT